MKHLKRYNESFIINDEDTFDENTIDIIKDRLIDLDDKGFEIYISHELNNSISVTIERANKNTYVPNRFFTNEILDEVTALISHMNNEYSLGVMICHDTKYHNMVNIIGKTKIKQLEDMSYQPINGLVLQFYKRLEKKHNESFIIGNKEHCEKDHGDTIDIIKDRLLELDDKGFEIYVSSSTLVYVIDTPSCYDISVVVKKRNFLIKEILDDIIPLISNLDNEYILNGVSMQFRGLGTKYHNMVNIIGKTKIEQLTDLSDSLVTAIEFKFRRKTN